MQAELHTQRIYYTDTYLSELNATVLKNGSDEKGPYFVPDQTIFHPQGGGQPADKGSVMMGDQEYEVTGLKEDEGHIKHYFRSGSDEQPAITGAILLKIDMEGRKLFARLHSAGHLLANVAEELYPDLKGFKGDHFPGGRACVTFKGTPFPAKDAFIKAVEEKLKAVIAEERPLTVSNETTPRTVTVEGYQTHPCGGTHVRHTGELGVVTIRSFKSQKGELKVGYNVT